MSSRCRPRIRFSRCEGIEATLVAPCPMVEVRWLKPKDACQRCLQVASTPPTSYIHGRLDGHSRKKATSFALVGDVHALLQHEAKPWHSLDVVQRIAVDPDQIGQLAHLDRAELVAHAADGRAVPGRCHERLPRCGAIAHPEPQLEQGGLLERPNVRTQR